MPKSFKYQKLQKSLEAFLSIENPAPPPCKEHEKDKKSKEKRTERNNISIHPKNLIRLYIIKKRKIHEMKSQIYAKNIIKSQGKESEAIYKK